jgi:hypothetical protein
MAALSAHPHVVAVHGAGVAPDGRPYLVMEHCPGPHLAERARRGELAVADVLRVGVQLASALETAHRAGIVHGDVRPANVLVGTENRVGLTDFAATALAIDAGGPASSAGRPGGSVAADVYALCATLHGLLAGQPPTTVQGEVPRLTGVDVPSSLRDLVAAGLDPDPARRPPSAQVLAEALQAIERERNLDPTPFAVIDPRSPHHTAGAVPPSGGPASVVTPPEPATPPAGPPGAGPVTGPATVAGPVPHAPNRAAAAPPPLGPPATPPLATGAPAGPVAGTTGEDPNGARRRARIGVAALAALVLLLGTGFLVTSRRDPSALATAETAAEDPSASTIRSTTTDPSVDETTTAETREETGTEAGPTDPTIGAPSNTPGPETTRRPAPTTRPTVPGPPPPPPTTAPPTNPTVCASGNPCAGRATWTSGSRQLRVCDEISDGYDAVAEYRRSDVGGTDSMVTNGRGTCNDDQLSMRAGATVTFRVCLRKDRGSLERCSGWVTGQA